MSKFDKEISERVKKMSPAHRRAFATKKINPDFYHTVRLSASGPHVCGNFSAPCTVGKETNYVLACTLRKGHKGKHKTTFDGRTICWQWSRHQCCSFS